MANCLSAPDGARFGWRALGARVGCYVPRVDAWCSLYGYAHGGYTLLGSSLRVGAR